VINGAVITFVDITEQKHGHELRRLGTVTRDSNDAVTVQDFDGKIWSWNRGASQMYGWTEAEALAMNSLDMVPETKRAEILALYERLAREETVNSFETQRVRRDGQILDVWMTLTVLVDDANQPVGIATTERDITARKQASQIVSFENRALKAANQWYKILLERTEHAFLFHEACQILVEDAGYCLAWIGRVEKAETITPVACFGVEEGEPVAALAKQCRSLVGRALRSGLPVAVCNIPSVSAQKHWRVEARKHHFGSFLALPLILENGPLGILMIYATEPEAFVSQEVESLSRLSNSIAQSVGLDWKATEPQE